MLWSSVVDAPIKVGTRAELSKRPKLLRVFGKPSDGIWVEEPKAFKTADEHGSSNMLGFEVSFSE